MLHTPLRKPKKLLLKDRVNGIWIWQLSKILFHRSNCSTPEISSTYGIEPLEYKQESVKTLSSMCAVGVLYMYRKMTSPAVLSVFSVCLCLSFSPFFFEVILFLFLNSTGYGECLLDEPVSRPYSLSQQLPGRIYNVNKQCELIFGPGTQVCPYMVSGVSGLSKLSCCTRGSLRETSSVMIMCCRGSQLNFKSLKSLAVLNNTLFFLWYEQMNTHLVNSLVNMISLLL